VEAIGELMSRGVGRVKGWTNVNELEKVTDPLAGLAPLATLSPRGARAGIQVDAPLAPLGERVPEVRGQVRGSAGP